MRTWRDVWSAVVLVLAAAAAIAGPVARGPLQAAVLVVFPTAWGAAFGIVWHDDPDARARSAVRLAMWCGASGVLVAGLPPLLGPWSLLVLVLVGVLAPGTVAAAAGFARSRRPTTRPEDLSDRDLLRRWRRTTDALHSRWATEERSLRLVQERAFLLDELERRDPHRFGVRLEQLAADGPDRGPHPI